MCAVGQRRTWSKTLLLLLGPVLMVLLRSACAFSCKESNLPQDPFAAPCSYPYSVPTLPQVSIHPDGLVIRQDGSRLTLACDVLDATPTSQSSTVYTFSWEINGKIVRNNTNRLELVVSEEKAGVYRCIVGAEHEGQSTSLATVASSPVTLKLPSIDGWINYFKEPTNQSQSAVINRVLPIGGFTVLECEPRTNNPLPSYASVSWLRNSTPIVNGDPNHHRLDKWRLLVNDFVLEKEEAAVQYTCVVAGLQFFNKDHNKTYILSTSEDGPRLPDMLPTSQTVVVGGNATFYCFTGYNQLSNVTWWKDGAILTRSGRQLAAGNVDGTSLAVQEVLVVSNVTSEDGGVYSCVGASGIKHSATLTVVSPPIPAHISATQNNILRIGNDLITWGHDVNLTCLSPTSVESHVTYTWYVRGELVPASSSALGMDGSTLALVGGSNGTVQCFASNEAGISSDAAIVLTQPRPPTNLVYNYRTDPGNHKIIYGFSFDIPKVYFTPQITFTTTVRVKAQRTRDPRVNVCNYSRDDDDSFHHVDISHTTGGVDLDIQDIVKNVPDNNILVEIAIIVNGITSDFVALRRVNGTCKIPVHIAVIQQNFISEQNISYNSYRNNSWQLSFNWPAPDSVNSGFLIYGNTSLSCSGQPILNNLVILNADRDKHISSVSVPSCSPCDWTVSYFNPERSILTNSITFLTKPAAPTFPPDVSDIHRVGGDGKTVQITFTIPPQSCNESELWVKYSLPSDTVSSSAQLRLNDDSCSLAPDSTPHSYTCAVALGRACWQPYNVSLAYSNSGKDTVAGPYSTPFTLSGITKDHLQVEGLSVRTNSSHRVQLQLNYSQGLDCLLKSISTYQLKVCWGELSRVGRDCLSDTSDHVRCNEVTDRLVDIDGLTANTTYVYHALVVDGNETVCSPNGLVWTTDSDTLTKMSSQSHLSSNRVAVAVSVTVSAVLLLVVVVMAVVCTIARNRKKKKNHHHNISPLQENYQANVEDPVDVARHDRMDAQSEGTTIQGYHHSYVMQRFIEGCEEQFMSDEDHYNRSGTELKLDTESDSAGYMMEESLSRRESKIDSSNNSRKKLRKKRKKVRKSNEESCSESTKLLDQQEIEEEDEMLNSDSHASTSNKTSYVSNGVWSDMASDLTQTEQSRTGNSTDDTGYIRDISTNSHQQCSTLPVMSSSLRSGSNQSSGETSATTLFPELLFHPRSTQMDPISTATHGACSPSSVETSLINWPSIQYNQTPHSMSLVRTVSGGQSSSSGYASQSVDSSMGWRAQDFEQQQPSSEYIANENFIQGYPVTDSLSPVGFGNFTAHSSSDYTALHGSELKEPTTGTADQSGSVQNEQAIVVKSPAEDDDNGSLSSDSVFSESISFSYSDIGHTRERQSEGYCSFPFSPNNSAPLNNEDEATDYMNVLKNLKDVQFTFSN